MDFQEFKDLNLSEIEKWKHIKLSESDIQKWKDEGCLIDKLFEFKMKRLYLEYIKVKTQNMLSQVDPFDKYDPIKEAELIIREFS